MVGNFDGGMCNPSFGSLAQQSTYEVSQLFVGSVFALELSVKYLKVTFSCAQKPVKFRSGFIYYENVN